MSDHDTELQRTRSRDQEGQIHFDRSADADSQTQLARKPTDPAATWKRIEQILNREIPATDLRELVSVLDEAHRAQLRARIKELSQIAGGDTILEISEFLKPEPSDVIVAALDARPPATAPHLRRYLAAQSVSTLATIRGASFDRLRATLREPLLDAVPAVADQLVDFDRHPGFMRWFVTTTEPGLCASIISRSASQWMAQTLDAENLWTWVDHLVLGAASDRILILADETKIPTVKQKLTAALGPRAGKSFEQVEALRVEHREDVSKEVANPQGTRAQLLEAIDNAGGVRGDQSAPLITKLHTLRASADDVLAVIDVAQLSHEQALQLLLAAPGVTGHHLTTFLVHNHAVAALADPAILKDVRRRIGTTLRLQDTFRALSDEVHNLVADHQGLRDWFFESANASDLLWFCSEDGSRSTRATRIVAERHPDWRWVHELTSASNDKQLRSLALNCNDHKTQQYIRDVLLGDYVPTTKTLVQGAQPTDEKTRGGQGGRLVDSLEGPRDEVMARLADLSDGERTRLGGSEDAAVIVGKHVGVENYARAAYLLDLSVEHTIAGSPGASLATAAYLATRPHPEQAVAMNRTELVPKAQESVHRDLLVVFSLLRDPHQLAAALMRQPELLRMLLEGSDPGRVMELVSSGPAQAPAEAILDQQPALLDKLPRYKHMTKAGRAAVDQLDKAAPAGGDGRDALDSVRTGESEPKAEVVAEGKTLHNAERKPTLAAAIDELVARKGSSVSAMALLEDRKDEVPGLLASTAQWTQVGALAALIGLPPNVACPFITSAALLAMPNGLRWWFQLGDGTNLLHHITTPAARGGVAHALDSDAPGARTWLGALPKGPALSDDETHVLDQLRPFLNDAGVLRDLFAVRFGMPSPPEYDAKTTAELYKILVRLPSAHLRQQRIHAFTKRDLSAVHAAGLWSGLDVRIDDHVEPGLATDTLHPTTMQGWHTSAEMKTLYGFDEAALAHQVAEGNVERMEEQAIEKFRVKEVKLDLFEQVVLHEVGHSVDAILGERTPPVYEFAGWREHNDFNTWAAEMGGWDQVAAADKPQIEAAWRDATRAETSVKSLVGPEHPALAKHYERAGVGVVVSAIAGKTMIYQERVQHGDRVFIAQSSQNSWYSLSAAAASSAPSAYALNAPVEYFAESYVEYYRRVDGTPDGNKHKGGGLAAPVKKWFDENVDKLRYDPRRFTGGEESEESSPKRG